MVRLALLHRSRAEPLLRRARASRQRAPEDTAHARSHVLAECEGVGWLRATLWHLAPVDRTQQLWTSRDSQHLAQFHVALQHLGVRGLQLTLHRLRGGGAREHWTQGDIPRLRRRDRWTSERTLERHVQEGAFCLHAPRLEDNSGKQNPGARHAGAELLRKRAPRPTTTQATTE